MKYVNIQYIIRMIPAFMAHVTVIIVKKRAPEQVPALSYLYICPDCPLSGQPSLV